MKYRALVVDDDPKIRETVAEILHSLGHVLDAADSQEEARTFLASGKYDYVLLDLELPVRPGSGFARLVNGENLLTEIRVNAATRVTPVIVMTGHGSDGPALAVRLMKKGAVDFVNKPFDGDVLDRAILDALGKREHKVSAAATAEVKKFEGGPMTFLPDRVELCGVRILGDGDSCQMRRILDALRQKRDGGKFIAYEGSELAKIAKCRGGQNGVAGAIRDFRENVARLLFDELHLTVGPQDIIRSGGPGYRFAEQIEVQVASLNPAVGGAVADCTIGASTLDAAARKSKIIHEIRSGRSVRAPAIAKAVQCSLRTAKRELDELKEEGVVTFEGPTKTGRYRIVGAATL